MLGWHTFPQLIPDRWGSDAAHPILQYYTGITLRSQ
jgi:hypothetical protein